jgi:arrestin-related trafficking adapter 3/6
VLSRVLAFAVRSWPVVSLAMAASFHHLARQTATIPLADRDQVSRSCGRSREDEIQLFSGLNFLRSGTARRGSVCSTPNSLTPSPDLTKPTRRELGIFLQKLSGSRENAKRLLRLGTFTSLVSDSTTSPAPSLRRSHRPRPVSEIILPPRDAQMGSAGETNMVAMRSRSPSAVSMAGLRASRQRSGSPASDLAPSSFPVLRNEKVVATGVGITVSVALAEPALFLPAYDHSDPSTKKSVILRGYLHLKTTKAVKIKKVSVCFRGHAQTDWPDGKPNPDCWGAFIFRTESLH